MYHIGTISPCGFVMRNSDRVGVLAFPSFSQIGASEFVLEIAVN